MDQQQRVEVETNRKKRTRLLFRWPVVGNTKSSKIPLKGGFPSAPRGVTYFGGEIV